LLNPGTQFQFIINNYKVTGQVADVFVGPHQEESTASFIYHTFLPNKANTASGRNNEYTKPRQGSDFVGNPKNFPPELQLIPSVFYPDEEPPNQMVESIFNGGEHHRSKVVDFHPVKGSKDAYFVVEDLHQQRTNVSVDVVFQADMLVQQKPSRPTVFIELFAGHCGLSAAARELGATIHPFDMVLRKKDKWDLHAPERMNQFKEHIFGLV
jgi:hypothetical protein